MRWWPVMGCAGALVCCGSPQIQGSLSTLINLHYSYATLGYTGGSVDGGVMQNGQVSVHFLEPAGSNQNAVLIVTEDLTGLQVEPGGTVNLAEVPPSGVGLRGVVTRDVYGDPVKAFPAVGRGSMRLDGTPIPGSKQSMAGYFEVTFALCPDFACGYTAYASFTAQVQ